MIVPLTAACMAFVAAKLQISYPAMLALRQVEGGYVGQWVANRGSTGVILSRDIGPFGINDAAWLDHFAGLWGRSSREDTFALLRDNGCANALAAGIVFRRYLDEAHGDYGVAVGFYNVGAHSRSPQKAEEYRRRFIAAWRRQRLDATASRQFPSGAGE